ncbi:MAG: phosphoribosyltransferase [Mesorhizobium sp.]|nr:MAG: phosphoribosyltransferase [Mesorhizobium sp.]
MAKVFRDSDNRVVSLGDYKPWSVHKSEGGDFTNYPAHSGHILDVKDNKANGIKHFADALAGRLHDGIAIAVVPSHDPAKKGGGLAGIAAALAASGKRIDASQAIVRTKKIEKLAHGGDRSFDVHTASIAVAHPDLIKGRDVLLLDDVHKTGNSLKACKEALMDAGANSVQCAALGSTW